MEIREIRQFMEWCAEGPSTFPQRRALFESRKAHMEDVLRRMNRTLDMLKFKCWYYEQAMQDGSDEQVKQMIPEGLPEWRSAPSMTTPAWRTDGGPPEKVYQILTILSPVCNFYSPF